jgi:hypothetical protein
MLIDISRDRMGNMVLSPISERVRRQMRAHTYELTGNTSQAVWLDERREDEFLEHGEPQLSPAELAHVNRGYIVTKRIDPWNFGLMVGYDFEHVINP